ncbi:MAG TPA: RNA polymerase sigma factor [Candidatus Cybelea sp.]|nr:RNA polymerase sigma factor [Candidatus Cybelea sp.]
MLLARGHADAPVTGDDLDGAIAAIWRIESPRLIATLSRLSRDVARAEDLAQDAFVAALSQWPDEGIPHNPGAWLMTTAKRRAIDQIRRNETLNRLILGSSVGDLSEPDFAESYEEIDDDMLRLMFVACHPIVSKEAHVALTLKLVGGLTSAEIARAFLVPEGTIAQRIVRAKRTLSDAGVPFDVPSGSDRLQRLASILETIYLIFNEGYAATAGDDVLRPELVEDALRLGRMLAALMPQEREVLGLVALMEIQASRMRARVGPAGEPILLLDQDRSRWNRLLIGRGLNALARAQELGAALGPYGLQAAIAACHARAGTAEQTDWSRIAALYDALAQLTPTPVVELNRAVAVGMAFGPRAGLEIVDPLMREPSLQKYHLLPAVRADLLFKLGLFEEAKVEFERAASMARNSRDQTLLLARAQRCHSELGGEAP